MAVDIYSNTIWQKGHDILPYFSQDGDNIKLSNVRDLDYITGKENYYHIDFSIKGIKDVWLIHVPFGWKNMMSHVMLQYDFDNGESVVLSVEARRQPGESFSAFRGLFKNFGLIYIWGSVNDLIGLRKTIRKVDVFKYKLRLTDSEKQKSLSYYLQKTNDLIDKPEFYDTFSSNCTTNLWDAFKLKDKADRPMFSWKVFFSGYVDEYLYDIGYIEDKGSFELTKQDALMGDSCKL